MQKRTLCKEAGLRVLLYVNPDNEVVSEGYVSLYALIKKGREPFGHPGLNFI